MGQVRGATGGFSRHPIDQLIRDLIGKRQVATAEASRAIVHRMANAPFDPRVRAVPEEYRELRHRGRPLGPRADSLLYHLAKRVVDEKQWAPDCTAEQYLADLRRAILAPDARLAVYRERGGHIAATLTPTDSVVPESRRGPNTQAKLLVIYAADRIIIVTGYQISSLATARIPQDAQWLK